MSTLALTVEPSELESATSWVSRLAARNGCRTAQEFSLDLGISWKSIRVGDPEAIEAICALTGTDPQLLAPATYRTGKDGSSKMIDNEWIAPKFMRFDKFAVCVTCVKHSMQHSSGHLAFGAQVWWSFDGLRICPLHNEFLLELPQPGRGRCKHDFAGRVNDNRSMILDTATTPAKSEAGDLERYVVHRLSRTNNGSRRWIDQMDLATVVRASETLGLAFIEHKVREREIEEPTLLADAASTGFKMLALGPKNLESKLKALRYRRPKGGFYTDFFPFSRWLERTQDRSGCKPLVQAVRDFAVVNYPYEVGDLVFGEPVEIKHLHSISSSAAKARVPFPRMRKALGAAREGEALKHLPRPNKHLWVRAQDWDPWLDEFGRAITLKPAAQRLGVCSDVFMQLVSAGYLKPLAKVPEMAPRYLPSDIDAFIELVSGEAKVLSNIPKGMLSLSSVQSSCRTGMVQVIHLLVSRQLSIVGRLPHEVGLKAICVSKEEVLDRLEGPPLPGLGSIGLRKYLGINCATIPWLVSNGYLWSERASHPRTRKSIRLFRYEAIEQFLSSYETVGRISHRLNKKPPYVVKLLKGQGIEPIPVERNMSVFFRREDLPIDFL